MDETFYLDHTSIIMIYNVITARAPIQFMKIIVIVLLLLV